MKDKNERVKEALIKIKSAADEMKASTDISFVKKKIRISNYFTIELNSIRDYLDDFGSYGKHLYFEVYAIVDGKDVDCMTINTYRNFDEDVTYLLNCYMWDEDLRRV